MNSSSPSSGHGATSGHGSTASSGSCSGSKGSSSGIILPEEPSDKEKRAERAILLLYLFFFVLWSIGLALGLYAENALFQGLPLWFWVGAVASYPITCLALHLLIRRMYS